MQNIFGKIVSVATETRASFALFVALLVATAASAANDYSALETAVTGELTGVSTVLMGIGAAIVGVAVVLLVIRFVRGAMH